MGRAVVTAAAISVSLLRGVAVGEQCGAEHRPAIKGTQSKVSSVCQISVSLMVSLVFRKKLHMIALAVVR